MPSKMVVSLDGTKIWAESRGNTAKQAVVWIHGGLTCALHFEKAFNDEEYLANLHMVSGFMLIANVI